MDGLNKAVAPTSLVFGPLIILRLLGKALVDDQRAMDVRRLPLTHREFRMLEFLALRADRFVSTHEIVEKLGYSQECNGPAVHIFHLRKKFKRFLPNLGFSITNRYKYGYRFQYQQTG